MRIGEFARRETQACIQRHVLDPLPFAGAVDHPLQLKGSEDRLISPAMKTGQSAQHPSLARGQRLALIAVTEQRKKPLLKLVAQL